MGFKSIFAASPSLPAFQLRLRQIDLALTHIGLFIILVHFIGHGYPWGGIGPMFLSALAISTVWNILSIKLHHKIHPYARPFFNGGASGYFIFVTLLITDYILILEANLDFSIQNTAKILQGQNVPSETKSVVLDATSGWQAPLQDGNVYQIVPYTLLAAITGLCACIHLVLFVKSCIEVHRHRRGTPATSKTISEV